MQTDKNLALISVTILTESFFSSGKLTLYCPRTVLNPKMPRIIFDQGHLCRLDPNHKFLTLPGLSPRISKSASLHYQKYIKIKIVWIKGKKTISSSVREWWVSVAPSSERVIKSHSLINTNRAVKPALVTRQPLQVMPAFPLIIPS